MIEQQKCITRKITDSSMRKSLVKELILKIMCLINKHIFNFSAWKSLILVEELMQHIAIYI